MGCCENERSTRVKALNSGWHMVPTAESLLPLGGGWRQVDQVPVALPPPGVTRDEHSSGPGFWARCRAPVRIKCANAPEARGQFLMHIKC